MRDVSFCFPKIQCVNHGEFGFKERKMLKIKRIRIALCNSTENFLEISRHTHTSGQCKYVHNVLFLIIFSMLCLASKQDVNIKQ